MTAHSRPPHTLTVGAPIVVDLRASRQVGAGQRERRARGELRRTRRRDRRRQPLLEREAARELCAVRRKRRGQPVDARHRSHFNGGGCSAQLATLADFSGRAESGAAGSRRRARRRRHPTRGGTHEFERRRSRRPPRVGVAVAVKGAPLERRAQTSAPCTGSPARWPRSSRRVSHEGAAHRAVVCAPRRTQGDALGRSGEVPR